MYRSGFVVLAVLVLSVSTEKFKVIREWRYLNFTWSSPEIYQTAFSQGNYLPENNIIAGVKQHQEYFYLTLPRMKPGVPATLARVPAGPVTRDTAPLLEPFPSWAMNQVGDCQALQNVQNVEIDAKGQMWIIDGGRTETLGAAPVVRCPPKLVIYDIKQKSTTTFYTFPDEVASYNSSFLYDIVVDDTDGGYAYISDNSAKDPGLIVFSLRQHHSWKIRHSATMHADKTASAFRVNSITVSAPINLAGIALGPRVKQQKEGVVVSEERELYYCPMSSLHLYSISTTILRNEMNGFKGGEYQGEVKDYGLKGSQTAGMTMDNQGTLYYTLLATNSIAKWDTRTPFLTNQKIIAKDEKYLEWPNSFTFDQSGNITVLVNRLNRFIYGKLSLDEPNFRLITAKVDRKSYLYDEVYDYSPEMNLTTTTMTPNTEKLPEPQLLPGSDQDPNLAPHFEPTKDHQTTTMIPTTTMNHQMNHTDHDHQMQSDQGVMNHDQMHDHMNHDHKDHDHMNHDHNDHDHMDHEHSSSSQSQATMSTTTEKPNSANAMQVSMLLSILFGAILFVM